MISDSSALIRTSDDEEIGGGGEEGGTGDRDGGGERDKERDEEAIGGLGSGRGRGGDIAWFGGDGGREVLGDFSDRGVESPRSAIRAAGVHSSA